MAAADAAAKILAAGAEAGDAKASKEESKA
jgi:hypothetical protein